MLAWCFPGSERTAGSAWTSPLGKNTDGQQSVGADLIIGIEIEERYCALAASRLERTPPIDHNVSP
jgi:hypothetical protein